jgi:hypothetical protein
MREHRCKNSGALLFNIGPREKETLSLKKETKELKERIEKLEAIIQQLIEKD